MYKILVAGNTGMSVPNSPRNSKHKILFLRDYRHLYIPQRIFQKFWRPLEGVNFIGALSPQCDLIHSFNSVLYTRKKWIITFESILPRTIGCMAEQLGSIIREKLTLDNCRKIIAMSDFAKETFIKMNRDWMELEIASKKLAVIHPNFPVKTLKIKQYLRGETIKLIFIGNDFARKGGIVALRVAEKARKMKLPIQITLVSKMHYGPKVYTDCIDTSKYAKDIELLKELDNIKFYENLPNEEVVNLLSNHHFQVMCTLDDTYGYSILEGFSVGTPAITTNVCALPEFVNKNNGFIIDLELNEFRRWIYLENRIARVHDNKKLVLNENDYWSVLDHTYNILSNQVLEVVSKIIESPESYEQLSTGSLAQANLHDTTKINHVFDELYTEIIEKS